MANGAQPWRQDCFGRSTPLCCSQPGMQQFQGKAMTGRALTYPIAIVIVPIGSWILHRSRPNLAYPHILDMLLGLPF